MKTINGKRYEQVQDGGEVCNNCVAEKDRELCKVFHENGQRCGDKIWEEIEMESALELVEQFRVESGNLSNRDYDQLKAAIEREQAAAIQMRPILEELQQRDGDTTNTLSNILSHWSPEKQKSLVRGIMGEGMIEMRPISEMPDRVPEGCVVVIVGERDSWLVTRFDINPREKVKQTGGLGNPIEFCIVPYAKPVAPRKLHACYMPGCGGDAETVTVEGGTWRVKCLKCGALGPRQNNEEAAKKAWGF